MRWKNYFIFEKKWRIGYNNDIFRRIRGYPEKFKFLTSKMEWLNLTNWIDVYCISVSLIICFLVFILAGILYDISPAVEKQLPD